MEKKIVIIGGGFAGINLAKRLKRTSYRITLVDRNNYTFFPPLLYQVATGFLQTSNISYPFRKMFRGQNNLHFKLGEVAEIDIAQNRILLSGGPVTYDYLVLATGTETNYFGMKNVQEKSIPMKTINDALEMKNYLLKQLELAATLKHDDERLKKLLTIVVAGGGPTGVEISGMLAEMKSNIIEKDYPELRSKLSRLQIYLIDGLSQLLSPMSTNAQENTYSALTEMGVNIILNARVQDYVDDCIVLSNGDVLYTENLIWAAGVTSQRFKGLPAPCYGRGNRLITDAFNKIKGLENVYAIGDTCIQQHEAAFPDGHPQVAQVALQQGKNLALNLKRIQQYKIMQGFSYRDKGSMAIIGRNKAVADLPPNLRFSGFIAWLMWVFVHLLSLVHYRNRISTLLNWIPGYFTRDQSFRMIIRPKSSNGHAYRE